MNIAERLRLIRTKLNLTQREASTKFHMPLTSWKSYEKGPSEPGSGALTGLATGGVNIHWLLTGEGEMLLADMQTAQYQDNQSAASLTLDREKIVLAIETVEEGLQITGRVMKPNKKAELIMAVYDLLSEQSEQQPPIKKETLLRLVKSAA